MDPLSSSSFTSCRIKLCGWLFKALSIGDTSKPLPDAGTEVTIAPIPLGLLLAGTFFSFCFCNSFLNVGGEFFLISFFDYTPLS
jgi:hypothetical protein